MRKYILMLSCSAVISVCTGTNVYALTPNEQLKALKEVFASEFDKMDTNSDGTLSKSEYLRHQFESFRANIMEADSFDTPINDKLLEGLDSLTPSKQTKTDEKESTQTPTPSSSQSSTDKLTEATNIMKDMAEYEVEEEKTVDDELSKAEQEIEALLGIDEDKKLTKEDVMPKKIIAEENETNLLEDLETLESLDYEPIEEDYTAPMEETKEQKQEKEILTMMSVVKKTLPKKIDDITSWVDIKYQDKVVSYIYKADVDISSFSAEDKEKLSESIKNESCLNAYTTMCPKIKPMFIDEGINMQIRYIDKQDKELSSCEFNQTTCK